MNGDIVSSSVCDFDDQGVAVVDFQGWARELAVDRYAVVCFAQPLHWRRLNLFHAKCRLDLIIYTIYVHAYVT